MGRGANAFLCAFAFENPILWRFQCALGGDRRWESVCVECKRKLGRHGFCLWGVAGSGLRFTADSLVGLEMNPRGISSCGRRIASWCSLLSLKGIAVVVWEASTFVCPWLGCRGFLSGFGVVGLAARVWLLLVRIGSNRRGVRAVCSVGDSPFTLVFRSVEFRLLKQCCFLSTAGLIGAKGDEFTGPVLIAHYVLEFFPRVEFLGLLRKHRS